MLLTILDIVKVSPHNNNNNFLLRIVNKPNIYIKKHYILIWLIKLI